MRYTTLPGKGAFRIEDWWQSKAALMMGMVYLFTSWFAISIDEFPRLAILSIATISGFASFGYLINDLFDIQKDKQAGKKNFLAGKPFPVIILLFLLSFSFLLLPWRYLPFDNLSAGLVITEIVLFVIYSLPPLRLKERGIAGVAVDAVYAHALPVVLISYTYSLAGGKEFPILPVSLLCIWQGLNGLRNILLHQYSDIHSDKKSDVKTFVATLSDDAFENAILYLIIPELVFGLLFFGFISFDNPAFAFCAITIVAVASVAFGLFRKKGIEKFLSSTWQFFPNNIYEKWLPPCNLLILAQGHPAFYVVLLLHLAVFNLDFYTQTFKTLFPLFRDGAVHGIILPGRKAGSFIINHFIYFLLLIFGVNLKKEKTSAFEYLKKRWTRNDLTSSGDSEITSKTPAEKKDWDKWWAEKALIKIQPEDLRFNQTGKNIFVFVVCGAKEHIDALHYSLQALKQVSKNHILVVTDSSRNAVPVNHDLLIDVETPKDFNHHQASIFLKTGLHKIMPPGNNYCYLDTDVVAVDNHVDEIFSHFKAPITFATDHCLMDKFSPSAVKCGCIEQYGNWAAELRMLFKKYKHLTRQPEDEIKKAALLKELDSIKQRKMGYAFITLKFWLSPRKFKLHGDAILDKQRQVWLDKKGNAILYEKEDNAIEVIESTTDFRCDKTNQHRWTIYGHEVFDCRCNHLLDAIRKTFAITIANPKWKHWNGGVFLFNEQSHAFLDSWHKKTLEIFENPEWKTRDQGTLIATVWENNLQNHPTLPIEFNLIADYNHLTMTHKGDLCFDINKNHKEVRPHFVHVYHHWADKKWDVWQAVEKRTGIVIEPESEVINSLWIGNKLSALELLTIHSFLQKGHKFKLWLYDSLENDLPPGVEIGDASAIIPASQVFSYSNANTFGHGKGSYAGFSDIFRYKLLYEYGGWWVDMDVSCLKPFNFDKPYFFRSHHQLDVVGNVMKCPRHSELMLRCYEEAAASVNHQNTDWHKPIDILNSHIKSLQLESYIYRNTSNEDHWDITSKFLWSDEVPPDSWHFIHWQNEEWRSKKVSKTSFYYDSVLAKMLENFNLAEPPSSSLQKITNTFKHSKYFRHLFI
jgi:4-hydroxybenzoate polyprenyltransferase